MLTIAAGIVVAETQLFAGEKGDSFFATRRFDRSAGNRHFHIHSFSGLVQLHLYTHYFWFFFKLMASWAHVSCCSGSTAALLPLRGILQTIVA